MTEEEQPGEAQSFGEEIKNLYKAWSGAVPTENENQEENKSEVKPETEDEAFEDLTHIKSCKTKLMFIQEKDGNFKQPELSEAIKDLNCAEAHRELQKMKLRGQKQESK